MPEPQYQTTAACSSYQKIVAAAAAMLLAMLSGLFYITLDSRTIAAETKGSVEQLKWIVEDQITRVAVCDHTGD